jgi:hypothetical protein
MKRKITCRKKYEEKKIHVKGFKILVKNVPWCSSDELKIEKDEVDSLPSCVN